VSTIYIGSHLDREHSYERLIADRLESLARQRIEELGNVETATVLVTSVDRVEEILESTGWPLLRGLRIALLTGVIDGPTVAALFEEAADPDLTISHLPADPDPILFALCHVSEIEKIWISTKQPGGMYSVVITQTDGMRNICRKTAVAIADMYRILAAVHDAPPVEVERPAPPPEPTITVPAPLPGDPSYYVPAPGSTTTAVSPPRFDPTASVSYYEIDAAGDISTIFGFPVSSIVKVEIDRPPLPEPVALMGEYGTEVLKSLPPERSGVTITTVDGNRYRQIVPVSALSTMVRLLNLLASKPVIAVV